MRTSWNEEQFIQAVRSHTSMSQVLRALGLQPAGGNYKTLHYHVARLGLDTSHWKGKGWNKGLEVTCREALPLVEILVEGSHYSSNRLRKRLIKEGYFQHKCYKCQRSQWLGALIPLELEHINGINNDHRLGNLTLLCPNCHALTPTYRGRNQRTHALVSE